jgi:hypothetical protein
VRVLNFESWGGKINLELGEGERGEGKKNRKTLSRLMYLNTLKKKDCFIKFKTKLFEVLEC